MGHVMAFAVSTEHVTPLLLGEAGGPATLRVAGPLSVKSSTVHPSSAAKTFTMWLGPGPGLVGGRPERGDSYNALILRIEIRDGYNSFIPRTTATTLKYHA